MLLCSVECCCAVLNAAVQCRMLLVTVKLVLRLCYLEPQPEH
jgi:hypothetical protein